MNRIKPTTGELFLRLGATPRIRSARADRLFRKLRAEDALPTDDVDRAVPLQSKPRRDNRLQHAPK
jgi:hypothetical protein